MDLRDDPYRQDDPLLRQALEVDARFGTQLSAITTSRRAALKAAAGGLVAAVGAGAFAAAGAGGAAAQTVTTLPRLGTSADQRLMAFLQSVSTAAADVYRQLLGKGILESPEVEVVTVFRTHHVQGGDAWGAALGTAASSAPNAAIVAELQPSVDSAATKTQVLTVLFDLEAAVGATLLSALEDLEAPYPAQIAASLLSPASQRQVVLGQALALESADFLPDFETTAAAYRPAQFPLS